MKFLKYAKDGGPESKSFGFFIVEIKSLFSIVLLHFTDGSRDAYHNHAFNAVSWILRGKLEEHMIDKITINTYCASFKPIVTLRSTFHKVVSIGDTWAITFRGPWNKYWNEHIPIENKNIVLTHGRKVVYETH